MKANLFVIGLALLLSFAGCGDSRTNVQLVDRAELLLDTDPDSAYILLDSIWSSYELSARLLARWCMLSGEAADRTYQEMPYVSDLKRAQTWFHKHGTPEEQARIGLFLGRSYVEDKEYEKAMDTYLSALDVAVEEKVYNQAGYISSYMADLYAFEEMNVLAVGKCKEAASYFQQAENKKSYGFALRDVGQIYAFMDSCEVALSYLQEANAVLTSLGDSSALSSIYNGLGNVYAMLGQLDLSEKYQLESIRLDSTDNAPNYLALSKVYRESGDYQKARLYVEMASISSYNEFVPIAVVYNSYLIEKADKNESKAYMHLEAYTSMLDSIKTLQNEANIIEVEKRFDNLRVLADNMQLSVDKQRNQVLFISIIALCLLALVIYQIGINRKNRKIAEQNTRLLHLSSELFEKKKTLNRQALSLEQNKQLLRLQGSLEEQEVIYRRNQQEVEQLNDNLLQLRKDMLQASPIARKLKKLSAKVIAKAAKPLLSERDWKTIISTVDDVYPSFSSKLLQQDFHLTPMELNYCYLTLFELDSNAESILLNISAGAVTKNYQRLRQKLQITGKRSELYSYLVKFI